MERKAPYPAVCHTKLGERALKKTKFFSCHFWVTNGELLNNPTIIFMMMMHSNYVTKTTQECVLTKYEAIRSNNEIVLVCAVKEPGISSLTPSAAASEKNV